MDNDSEKTIGELLTDEQKANIERSRFNVTIHREYMILAAESSARAIDLLKNLPQMPERVGGRRDEAAFRAFCFARLDSVKWIKQSSFTAIVFSAFAVEAFINHYYITAKSKSSLNKYLDKLSVEAKWIVFPKIVSGLEIDPGSAEMQQLKKLIGLRNQLAHYKTRQMSIQEVSDQLEVFVNDATAAVKAMRAIIQFLREHDAHARENFDKAIERVE